MDEEDFFSKIRQNLQIYKLRQPQKIQQYPIQQHQNQRSLGVQVPAVGILDSWKW